MDNIFAWKYIWMMIVQCELFADTLHKLLNKKCNYKSYTPFFAL